MSEQDVQPEAGAAPAPEFEKRGEIAEALDATPGLPTANPERQLRYFSPSQFKAFGECPARWYGEKVLGLSKPDTPATRLGREVHRICEHVSEFGAVPADAEQRAAGLARVLEPAIPPQEEVLAGDTFIEMEFAYQPEGFPLPLYGLMDKVRRRRKACEDYKTTSDFKYVLSEQELQDNVQAVIYVGYLMSPEGEEIGCYGVRPDGAKWVKFRHDYVRTKGAAQYRHAEVILVEPEVQANLKRLAGVATEMVRVASLPFEEVEKNLNACSNYGGCHMKGFCVSKGVAVPGADPTMVRYFQIMSEKENKNMALPKSLQGGLSAKRAEIAEQSSLNHIDSEGAAPAAAPSVPPVSRPALPQRTAPVPLPMGGHVAAPTVNPPDGIPLAQMAVPPPAAPITSDLDAEVREAAAAEAEAARIAKEAAKTTKVGLPGKKPKKAEVEAGEEKTAQAPADELLEQALQHPDVVAAREAGEAARKSLDAAEAGVAAAEDEDERDEAELALKKAKRKYDAAVTAFREARDKAYAELKAEKEAAEKEAAEAAAKAKAAAEAAATKPAPKPATHEVPVVTVPKVDDTIHVSFGPPPGKKKTLYLIGHPTKSPFVLWEDFIAPFTAQVEQDHQVPHWRMIKWENNNVLLTAILAAVRSGAVELPDNLVFLGPLNAQQHGTFTEALVPLYDEVVK